MNANIDIDMDMDMDMGMPTTVDEATVYPQDSIQDVQ